MSKVIPIRAVFAGDSEGLHKLIARGGHVLKIAKEKVPEIVLVYGGDGTFLRAEAEYPGIPKLLLRHSKRGNLFHKTRSNEDLIDFVAQGKCEVEEVMKLAATYHGVEVLGVNEIVVRDEDPRHALRFDVTINGKLLREEVIGDGVICATPLGSTGYFSAATGTVFQVGMGVGFISSMDKIDNHIIADTSVVRIDIRRGRGYCYADNHDETLSIAEFQTIEIKKSDKVARIIRVADPKY